MIDLIVFYTTHHFGINFVHVTNIESSHVKCLVKSANSIVMGKVVKDIVLSKS